MKEAIAEELKFLRMRNGLTLKDVADDFDLNYTTIYRIESAKIYISTKKLETLLNYYKETPEDFLQNVIKNIQRKRMN